MSCTPFPGGVICHLAEPICTVTNRYCDTCHVDQKMLRLFEHAVSAPSDTCLNCGDEWTIEGRAPRPFRPGWRQNAINVALDLADTYALPEAEYDAEVAKIVAKGTRA